MKQCCICKKNKSLSEFSLQKLVSGEYRPMGACKECHSERTQRYAARNVAWLLEQKNKPCIDCKIELPSAVMQFDHVRGPKKKFGKIRNSRPALEAEIAKCEVRCPNCHSMRHYGEGTLGFDPELPM